MGKQKEKGRGRRTIEEWEKKWEEEERRKDEERGDWEDVLLNSAGVEVVRGRKGAAVYLRCTVHPLRGSGSPREWTVEADPCRVRFIKFGGEEADTAEVCSPEFASMAAEMIRTAAVTDCIDLFDVVKQELEED